MHLTKFSNFITKHFLITTYGKRNQQTAALTSQWVVLMEQKYVN